jgi:hypothetical protein
VPNPWNVEHLRRFYPRIVLNYSYVFIFLVPFLD